MPPFLPSKAQQVQTPPTASINEKEKDIEAGEAPTEGIPKDLALDGKSSVILVFYT